ncbi:transcriptional regulator, MarR family [Desulfarculus baarsii DSM 2075]|uniref:Transcriptional regulator, MarR family n=2 Tax=Desulfarculus baarsii TaxID=453230 RepID=E1QME7_DESB2|nr:transcriptional regulator, MarR family [Desulfarculus baarsii DSM 2075]
MNERMNKLGAIILRVFNMAVQNEKKPRNFGISELLYPSEIHMVMLVGDNPGAHLSELARRAGITRGAVSQVVNKLEKKNLICKDYGPKNNLRMVPVLTEKGKAAYLAHEKYHEEINIDIYAYVREMSEDDFGVVYAFLRKIEKMGEKLK